MDLPIAVPLRDASNLRDLGGWRTADGRRVRRGLVFRAPALSGLGEADLATVAALGLRTVCDLRGAREAEHTPVLLPGATRHALPIEPSVGAGLRDILATGQATGEDLHTLLRRAYEAYALSATRQYGTLFALLARGDAGPLLFHCTAGKDRTGFGAALLLSALGVGEEDVMADYLATNDLWRRESLPARDLPPELAAVLLRAHRPLLEAGLAAARAAHGTLEAYLHHALGVDAAALERLRGRLLEG